VPQFEDLREEWNRDHSIEVSADLISCGVTLGRTKDKEVQEAARLLADAKTTSDLQSVAHRVLSDTLGYIPNLSPISFDPDIARVELYSQIALHKRRIRIYPKNAIAWIDIARLYTALGQQDKAREAIRAATALSPDNRFVLRSTARFFVHADGKSREDQIEEGLYYLRKSTLMRADPWIMAAEISLSTIAKKSPQSLRWARAVADADSIDPWDLSELNGALATLAIQQGGIGKPGKLFNKSLRVPTENALAQAQWAADRYKVVSISERIFQTMRVPAFEALALKHRAERKWHEVIEDCRAWSVMDPTSTRPLILGGYIAEVALEDGEVAREFSERALLIAPNEPWAHNNLAVAFAYLGRIDDAAEHAFRFQLHDLPEETHTTYFATQGLLSYRRGEREKGLQLYLRAADTKAAQKDVGLRAMVMWHLLREEARLRAPDTKELTDILWKHTRSLPIPELETLRQRILHPRPSVHERAMALLKSVTEKGSQAPSIRDSVAKDFSRLFEEKPGPESNIF